MLTGTCMLITWRSSGYTGWMIYQFLGKDSDGSASLHSSDMLQAWGTRSAGAGWGRFHEHNWWNPARQPESCRRMLLVPTSLLESRLRSINLKPQLCDRLSSVIDSAHFMGFSSSLWKRLQSQGAGLTICAVARKITHRYLWSPWHCKGWQPTAPKHP